MNKKELEAQKQKNKELMDARIEELKKIYVVRSFKTTTESIKFTRKIAKSMGSLSENIEAISIVDHYLEHSRIYIFANDGNPEVFISSADFMTRNIDARVEVTCPIYDNDIKQNLIDSFEINWKANVKARLHSQHFENKYRKRGEEKIFRAQQEMYKYYQNKIDVISETI